MHETPDGLYWTANKCNFFELAWPGKSAMPRASSPRWLSTPGYFRFSVSPREFLGGIPAGAAGAGPSGFNELASPRHGERACRHILGDAGAGADISSISDFDWRDQG
jgi:hypothetical protein